MHAMRRAFQYQLQSIGRLAAAYAGGKACLDCASVVQACPGTANCVGRLLFRVDRLFLGNRRLFLHGSRLFSATGFGPSEHFNQLDPLANCGKPRLVD